MSVWFVTGKLGAGKGLISCGKVKDYLSRGRPVATNCDIYLHHMFPKHHKNIRLMRFPDRPTAEDMELIGRGQNGRNEKENGLIVFDECGDWFNARSYTDKSRAPLMTWLRHARKKGWDIIFQVQDFSLIDKQARDGLGEHIVYCKRLDKLPVPFVSAFLKLFLDYRLPLPQLHIGTVVLGTGVSAMIADTWTYYGSSLYSCYDTNQEFTSDYPHAVHSVLPPWYTHRKTIAKKDWRFFMRMTKIYWKRFSAPLALLAGALLMNAYFLYSQPVLSSEKNPVETVNISDNTTKINNGSVNPVLLGHVDVPAQVEQLSPLIDTKLNYLLWDRHGKNKVKILYGGTSFDYANFPYKLFWRGDQLYASIPEGDETHVVHRPTL